MMAVFWVVAPCSLVMRLDSLQSVIATWHKLEVIIIINNFKDWANWSVPRQLPSQLVMFSPFSCLCIVGGKPAASAQFLLNPDSSAGAI
jgi:hypothetical protein